MKKILWKILDKLVRSLDRTMLDGCRKLIPIKIKRPLSRFLMKNIKLKSEYITSNGGHKFKAISEPVFLQVVYDGEYEKDLSSVTRQLLREGDNVIDVGANFGWYSILMADAIGAEGHVYSFEPNKNIYGVLEENVRINHYDKRVTIEKCGVGEKKKKAVLMAENQESGIGYFNTEGGAGSGEGESIEIRSLDDEFHDLVDSIAFIKIDVEGFEPFVLEGAQKILTSDNPPVMLMEFNIEALERSNTNIDSFVRELGEYGATAVVENGELKRLKEIKKENENIFFFPKRGVFAERPKKLFMKNDV